MKRNEKNKIVSSNPLTCKLKFLIKTNKLTFDNRKKNYTMF